MLAQLNPPLPLTTWKGDGLAQRFRPMVAPGTEA